ncbi:hypothetical protein F1559_001150 [Cyanidiococcus yangmingshanensis]|uniref:Telomeric single stranded DNA binding POT1/Cdc13 domain-containing protein n=1 Tax=Cyanidiococcus yangmingshanensis TaxID=2690220 RepID=A0A7J7IKD7_9RHOD|nr:hypothetical protein F1559_001150 [Cyanidiococcus yangmingshanensis]
MASRLVQLRSLKSYTCNASLPFRTQGRITRVFRADDANSICLALLEPWPNPATAEQVVVALVFEGRWRNACAPLTQWDVLEIENALVTNASENDQIQNLGLLQSCVELHDYALILDDRDAGERRTNVSNAAGAIPSVKVLQDAALEDRSCSVQINRAKPLSECSALSAEDLDRDPWRDALRERRMPDGIAPSKATFQESSVPAELALVDSRHRYVALAHLQSMNQLTGQSCDVYGVIVDVRAPRPVRTGELLTEIQIVDPSVVTMESDGHFTGLRPPKLMLTSFTSRLSDCIPYIGVGDVIRVHRAELRWYPQQSAHSSKMETLELKTNTLSSFCLWPALPPEIDQTKVSEASPLSPFDQPWAAGHALVARTASQNPPDPTICVYPPNTKCILITEGEKQYAMRMLLWARQFLSQSGFLGSRAFSATVNEILQEAEGERVANNMRARARYDLIAVIVSIERNTQEIQLTVADGSTTHAMPVYVAMDCWIRITHRLEPKLQGNWFRLRDVRLDRRHGTNWRLTMSEGSSIYMFPSWMPEVCERQSLLVEKSGTTRFVSSCVFPEMPISSVNHLPSISVNQLEARPDANHASARNASAMEYSPQSRLVRGIADASSESSRRETGSELDARSHQSWQHCSGPPALRTSAEMGLCFEELRPQTIAEAMRKMHSTRKKTLDIGTETPFLFRVYARVLDAQRTCDADSKDAVCFLLADVVPTHGQAARARSKHSFESNLATTASETRKRTDVSFAVPVWALGDDVKSLFGALEEVHSGSNMLNIDKALERMRAILTRPYVWIDVLLMGYLELRPGQGFSPSEACMSETRVQAWYQVIQPEVADSAFWMEDKV